MEKHNEALLLAEELLGDIELRRLEPLDIARKASRLSRLTDDTEAMEWLYYEMVGYPEGVKTLDHKSWRAAQKSNRVYTNAKGEARARTSGLGELQMNIETASLQLSAPSATPPSGYSAEPTRTTLSQQMILNRKVIDHVIGSIHMYAATKYQGLRFGNAVNNLFDNLRNDVDLKIGAIVPNALPVLSAAFENINSDNPTQWNNAVKACRDLIKSLADELRPPGEPLNGVKMDDASYINRLMEWIDERTKSKTLRTVIKSDLHDYGKRIDSFNDSGNKASHPTKKSKITQQQASRFVVGIYILLGDIIDLAGPKDSKNNKAIIAPEKNETESKIREQKPDKKTAALIKSKTKKTK